VLQCVALYGSGCCSGLCCSVLQCGTVWCSVLHRIALAIAVANSHCNTMQHCTTLCFGVLQCPLCFGVLQFFALCCSGYWPLQHNARHCNTPKHTTPYSPIAVAAMRARIDEMEQVDGMMEKKKVCVWLRCVVVCGSVLQCVAVYCSVWRRRRCVCAGCCNVLQCVAVYCSVLQCAAVCCQVRAHCRDWRRRLP